MKQVTPLDASTCVRVIVWTSQRPFVVVNSMPVHKS